MGAELEVLGDVDIKERYIYQDPDEWSEEWVDWNQPIGDINVFGPRIAVHDQLECLLMMCLPPDPLFVHTHVLQPLQCYKL